MLEQRDVLYSLSSVSGVFLPNAAMLSVASAPVRKLRTIVSYPDGTAVKLAFDETLELQAIVTSGPTPVAVSLASHLGEQTTHSLQSGTGDRELALPTANADRVRVRRVNPHGPRWHDLSVRINSG